MTPDPISEVVRLAEADIAVFEARMREVTPVYQRGDRVELHGEGFEVSSHQREGMPGPPQLHRLPPIPASGPEPSRLFSARCIETSPIIDYLDAQKKTDHYKSHELAPAIHSSWGVCADRPPPTCNGCAWRASLVGDG